MRFLEWRVQYGWCLTTMTRRYTSTDTLLASQVAPGGSLLDV